MTTPDTKAIRAQMEALAGFTAGPWNADLGETTYRVKANGMNIATANFVTRLDRIPTDQVGQNVRLIAAAPDIHATILAICDALDELRTIIDNLHHVEKKHRDTANDQFHRANRLLAENEQLMEALALIGVMGYSKDPAVNANIARMAVTQAREARALAQKGEVMPAETRQPVIFASCGWTGRRAPGNPVWYPNCGSLAAFQWRE